MDIRLRSLETLVAGVTFSASDIAGPNSMENFSKMGTQGKKSLSETNNRAAA